MLNINTTLMNQDSIMTMRSQTKINFAHFLKKSARAIMVGLLLIASHLVNAQEYIDIFKSDYSISPSNVFDSSGMETHLQEINGDLTVPIKVGERLAFLTGITYENISASFDPGRRRESLTGLTVKLGANIKYNSKWSGTYMFLPKVSSDLERLSNRDFQFGGAVLMKYTKTKHFNYKFGVYANKELFGTFIVPIVGFYYQSPSEKFEAKVLLPLSVDLNYSMSKRFKVGLNFKGQVRTYNLNNAIETETERYVSKSTVLKMESTSSWELAILWEDLIEFTMKKFHWVFRWCISVIIADNSILISQMVGC